MQRSKRQKQSTVAQQEAAGRSTALQGGHCRTLHLSAPGRSSDWPHIFIRAQESEKLVIWAQGWLACPGGPVKETAVCTVLQ